MFWKTLDKLALQARDYNKLDVLPSVTMTPVRGLHQGSRVVLDTAAHTGVNIDDSLIDLTVFGEHRVSLVTMWGGVGCNTYRAYLDGQHGAFIHMKEDRGAKGQMTECRLYTSYEEEIVPLWNSRWDKGYMGDETLLWDFWLEADSNPVRGGVIGNNVIYAGFCGPQYKRLWNPGTTRIPPVVIKEVILMNPGAVIINHQMMEYGRTLADGLKVEYFLISAVTTEEGASVNMWLGLDLDVTKGELKII